MRVPCHLEVTVFSRYFFWFPRLPFLFIWFPFKVVGNGPRRIWITFFAAKIWCKKLAGHSSLQRAQSFTYQCWTFIQPLNRTPFFEVQRHPAKDVELSIFLRTWSGSWEKNWLWHWLGAQAKMCTGWLLICELFTLDFHLTRPGYLQEASVSIWNFGSLLKSHSILRRFSSFPSLITNIAVFLSEVIRKELDNELTSVHVQWFNRLLKPMDFRYIPKGTLEFYKTIQSLFSRACGITTPQF